MHPHIDATPSSPLANIVEGMRASWSQDSTLLAQLDSNYERVYPRLERATRAFMEAWSSDTDQPFTVDKRAASGSTSSRPSGPSTRTSR